MEKPTVMSNALEKNGHRDSSHKQPPKGPHRNSDDRFENASTLAEGGVTNREKIAEETQRLANPLSGMSPEEVLLEADRFAEERDMLDIRDDLRKGALVAAYPNDFENIKELSEEEKEFLRWETTHPWRQTKTLWALVVCCAMGAVVQGQDQSLINGANIFFPQQFGIGSTAWRDVWLLGAVNSAPYFTCLLVACWVTDPLNRYFGRKGTIMISLVFATFPCVWAACSNSWQVLLASRVVLAFGIGPKSSTVPIYAAETAPPKIRGTLVMQWQLWTAFGIMIGYVCGLMFYNVSDTDNITGLNWRLMLGSGVVPPLIVLAQVVFLPESPRWLLSKNRPRKAYEALLRLRNSRLEAARDLFYISQLLKVEDAMHTGNRYKELFSIPRNRRASQSAFLVMFMQQFCGINVIAYYSSRIFVDSGFSQFNALLASWGFGMINWLGAIPAMKTIDTFGRRTLLLFGFPTMGFFLAFTGSMFYLPDQADGEATPVKLGLIAIGIYLFAMAYSPSEGPVPFTYSAEAFPLYIRPIGMAFATATCWGFNGVLALTFPALQEAFTVSGAFYFYAAFNLFGFMMVLLFLPETAKLSLEELDSVFSVPTRKQAQWGAKQPAFWWKRYVLRQKHLKPEPLYELDPSMVRTYAEASGAH